jgi:hypothetical protein
MKRLIARSLTFGALSAGAVLAFAAPAQADQISGFNSGILSGNQVSNVVQVPINVCGIAIGVLGDASANCVGGAYAINDSNVFYYNGGGGGNGTSAGSANHHHRRMANARSSSRTWSKYHR